MMKFLVRAATLLIVMAMLFTLALTGCQKNQQDNTPKTETKAEAKGNAETQATTQKPKERVTITVNVRDMGTVDPSVGTAVDNFFTKWLQENAPVKLNMVPTFIPEAKERITVMFAAGDAPDLIMHPWQNEMLDWASQGMLMPLDTLIQEKSTNYKKIYESTPGLQAYSKMGDGKSYFFCAKMPLSANHTMMLRKDWLDKLGLSIPKTEDEFFEVVKAFTFNDPDGNNKADTYGYDLAFIGGDAIGAMYGANKINRFYLDSDTITHSFDREKDQYTLMKKMYDAKVVSPDYLVDKNANDAKQRFLNGKLGIFVLDYLKIDTNFMKTFVENNPDGEIIPIPLPQTKNGSFSPALSPPYGRRYAINASTKYAEEIMSFIDWTLEPETVKILTQGFEGKHYTLNEKGSPVPIQTDEANKERKALTEGFYGQLGFNSQETILPETWWALENQFNMADPIQKKLYDYKKEAGEIYTSPERPYYIEYQSAPTLDDEMLLITSSVNQTILDLWAKSAISGKSYTVEQAYEEITNLWKSSGGDKVETFYKEWFENNQDNIVFTKDYYIN